MHTLEEKRTDDALEALSIATGKLDLLIAREPDLALAPTDVAVTYRDIVASNDDIKTVIDAAEDALDDGRVQDARQLLTGMGSEIVITVTELPLVAYTAAIKEIAPLIDAGEFDQTKLELEAILKTVVLTDYVTPLPYLRAEELLKQAEELAELSGRSEEQNEEKTSDGKHGKGIFDKMRDTMSELWTSVTS